MSHRPDLGFFDEGSDLASPAFYADAVLPPGGATTLPPAAFRSLGFTLLEDEAIWTRDWVCIGTHDEIPEVGDLLPFTVGTHGIHVQRTADDLAARFNKAQHGGCRAVPLQCQTGTKTRCSFTSCGHSRDRAAIPAGDLGDGTPEMHQYLGLRPERLLTAAVRSWGPLIFVNLDASPAPLEGVVAGLGASARFFGNHKAVRSADRWMEFAGNWKLVGQHLADGAIAAEGEHGNWMVADTRLADGTDATAAWLFPNLVLLATEAETCVVILQPSAIGQTLCRVGVYGGETDGAERWHAEIAARAARAEADHSSVVRRGSGSRESAALPLQLDATGLWMQRALADRVRAMPRETIDQPLFHNPKVSTP